MPPGTMPKHMKNSSKKRDRNGCGKSKKIQVFCSVRTRKSIVRVIGIAVWHGECVTRKFSGKPSKRTPKMVRKSIENSCKIHAKKKRAKNMKQSPKMDPQQGPLVPESHQKGAKRSG